MRTDVLLESCADELKKLAFKLHGHTSVQGIPIAIENRVGSTRSGTNEDGSTWKTKFKIPYGYIKGTKGADGEEVDAYIGPHKEAPKAYVVHQLRDDGSHDEDTVMLGFKSKAEARKGILAHYDHPKYLGGTHTVPIERLKELISSGKKLTKISAPTKRMDEKPGDTSSADTGKASYSPGQPSGGQGSPARPQETLRLYVGQTEPVDIAPFNLDVRTL
jgi:hypothetical protein